MSIGTKFFIENAFTHRVIDLSSSKGVVTSWNKQPISSNKTNQWWDVEWLPGTQAGYQFKSGERYLAPFNLTDSENDTVTIILAAIETPTTWKIKCIDTKTGGAGCAVQIYNSDFTPGTDLYLEDKNTSDYGQQILLKQDDPDNQLQEWYINQRDAIKLD